MRYHLVLVIACCPCVARLYADDVKPVSAEDPAHQQLRAMRDRVIEAFNKRDLDGLLANVDDNAVATWQDGEVCRGHKGIRDYYARMMSGPNHVVESVTAAADVDELTILHGDHDGIAFGRLDQSFKLTDGTDFRLISRWTAEVVKKGDRWLIAGLHVSANLFDNPVLSIAVRRTAYWTGGIASAVGLLVGIIGTLLVRRRRPA